MRYLLLALILLTPFAVSAARFDFTNGQPAVTDDGTATASETFEQTRYDFTSGTPSPVLDSTAMEEAGPEPTSNDQLVINNGAVAINNGALIIQ